MKFPIQLTMRTLEKVSNEWGPLDPTTLAGGAIPAQFTTIDGCDPNLLCARSKALLTCNNHTQI